MLSRHFLVLVFVLTSAACGGGDSPTDPVQEPDPSLPASLTLSGAPASLVVGDTFQLAASVRNEQGTVIQGAAVTWSSPDGDRLAVVSSGRFRSLAPGPARVVASAGGAADTLTVDADPRVVSSLHAGVSSSLFLTGDREDPRLEVRDQRGRTMEAAGVTWSVTDPAVLTVTPDGLVEALSPGTAEVRWEASGGSGPSTALEIRVFPGSGPRVPELVVVDSAVVAWMEAFSVPGAQVAVMREGRLVLSRGYGIQSVDAPDPVLEESLFRIGSVSKPLTGLAFLRLVDQGIAGLDDRPVEVLLDHYTPLSGQTVDPRLPTATAREILRHQTGYGSREVDQVAWRAVWQHGATHIDEVYRHMLGRQLDHDPGTYYQYTNKNTKTIARYIEVLTGTDIESFTREALMAPAGVQRMAFGRSGLEDRDPMEVRYHDETGATSALMDASDHVMMHWDASGAWIGTASDVLRVVRTALEGTPGTPPLLSPGVQEEVMGRNPAASPSPTSFMGLHWSVNLSGSAPVWSHTGAARGSWARLSYDHAGTAHMLVSNRHSGGQLNFVLDPFLANVDWPEHDLFDR